jgi:hypothetical protein
VAVPQLPPQGDAAVSADIPEQVYLDAGAARARSLVPDLSDVEVRRYAEGYARSEGHRAAVESVWRAALAASQAATSVATRPR